MMVTDKQAYEALMLVRNPELLDALIPNILLERIKTLIAQRTDTPARREYFLSNVGETLFCETVKEYLTSYPYPDAKSFISRAERESPDWPMLKPEQPRGEDVPVTISNAQALGHLVRVMDVDLMECLVTGDELRDAKALINQRLGSGQGADMYASAYGQKMLGYTINEYLTHPQRILVSNHLYRFRSKADGFVEDALAETGQSDLAGTDDKTAFEKKIQHYKEEGRPHVATTRLFAEPDAGKPEATALSEVHHKGVAAVRRMMRVSQGNSHAGDGAAR